MEDRGVTFNQFTGGLNNQADLSAIGDNQLASIVNLDVDSNGVLVGRPPIVKYANFPVPTTVGEFLGYYNRADGITFGVIAHNSKTYLWQPETSIYTEITTFAASGCAQYQNRLYLVARTTRGGWWGEITPGSGTYSYQSLAGGAVPMPFGDQIVLYKDRLFIAGWGSSDLRTTVHMSEVTTTAGTDINNWPVANLFYVGRGDGQWITALYPSTDVLNIFRNGSTYYFNYDTDPGLGSLKSYVGGVGADTKHCIAVYQNYLVTLSKGALYQLIGYQFVRLNDPSQVKLTTRTTGTAYTLDVALSVVGNRAIIWYSGETFVFDLNTRIWTQWDSPTTQGARFLVYPRAAGYFGVDVAYGITGSGDTSKFGIYRIIDEINATASEEMNHSIRTKAYDLSTPDRFKTLFWWMADVLTARTTTGTAVPIVLSVGSVSYDDLDLVTMDTLDLGTYDNLLTISPEVVTSRAMPASYPYRISVRFRKKMQFRRIYFEIALSSNGTTATGPVQIFNLVAYVAAGRQISKGVT